ncbi:glycosyltransferase family 2 protein, partial [Acinetobacter ursingii]|uniref:glycosyltransferase family 2 protein n=1 Tax=Acinetobacter ursingii TaxID=108980 RepID=UPI00313C529E
MKKLSIIIPVYGVEKYIEECISSICCQMELDVEVIIVNDGTQDRSIEIAKNVVSSLSDELQNCFIFLEQINQGQSVARNHALKIAKGEYIAFVDSDDVLSRDYLNNLIPLLVGVDIIQFKTSRFLNDSTELFDFNVGIVGLHGIHRASNKLLIDIFNRSAWFPWLNVYRKDLFLDLEFPIGVYFEDAIVIPEIFLRAQNIYFLDEVIYLYRINNEGSLLGKSKKNIEKKIKSYEYTLNVYVKKLNEKSIYSPCFISIFQSYILFSYQNFGFLKTKKIYDKISK